MIQRHGPLQGFVALQLPLQVPIGLTVLFNCRAETVPAHSTVVITAVRNVFWMIFLTMFVLLDCKTREPARFSSSGLFCIGMQELVVSEERRNPCGKIFRGHTP
jgi:predicted metal-binding membrane protein